MGADNTSTTYDLQGEVTIMTDPRGVEHAYTYDAAGRQFTTTFLTS